MPEYSDKEQHIRVSKTGGTVTTWEYKGNSIFFPQQLIQRGESGKIRGGMHACFPNFGTVASDFGLPQHGPLRARAADEEDEDRRLFFRGTDLLGNANTVDCEVRTSLLLKSGGFSYTLAARLRKLGTKPASLNAGLHPYFRTPRGTAQVRFTDTECIQVGRGIRQPSYHLVTRGVFVSIPGLGHITLQMSGSAWKAARNPQIVLWRDSSEYLCVEPVMGIPSDYGQPGSVFLTEDWLDLTCELDIAFDAGLT